MKGNVYTKIASELVSVASDGVVVSADGVYDYTQSKTQETINGEKADKSSTVSNVSYDSTNNKLTKTINGVTTDIVDFDDISGGSAELPSNAALFATDDGTGIVPEDGIKVNTITSAASMTIVADKVNVISGTVGTATITLSVPDDNLAHVWDILMTTGSSVNVTFATSNSATIKKPNGFAVGASKSCEISVIGVGSIFYLRYGEFT